MNEYSSMFLETAKKHMPKFNEGRACPDQYIGNIQVSDKGTGNPNSNLSNNDFAIRIDTKDFKRTDVPIVILITESPHTSEFGGEVIRPVAGDGYGDAGRAIRELFHEVCGVHTYLEIGEHPLVVLNAIQYQCSLGKATRKFRDKVFIKCWGDFGSADFKNRLKSLSKSGDIIINVCTAGQSKKTKLRELVKIAIAEIAGSATLELEHPCNWMRTRNVANKKKCSPNYAWKVKAQVNVKDIAT